MGKKNWYLQEQRACWAYFHDLTLLLVELLCVHNFDRDLGAWEINCIYKKLEKAMNQATYIEGNLNEQYISKLK